MVRADTTSENHSRDFETGVLALPQSTTLGLLIAAGQAGGLPILDATRIGDSTATDLGVVAAQMHLLCDSLGRRFGLKLDAHSSIHVGPLLEKLVSAPPGGPLSFILIAGECPNVRALLASLRPCADRIFREVVSQAEADEAQDAGADGVVAKGNESGGRVSSETTFVLLQRLCPSLAIPVWAQGGIGPHSMAACRVAGAGGVVLDGQLALAEESRLPESLKALVAAMDGSETVCLGETLGRGFRVHRLRGAASVRELRGLEIAATDPGAFTRRLEEILQRREGEPLFAIGQDAAFARRLAARHRNVAGILRAYRRQAADNLRVAASVLPLSEGGPLAQAHGTRFPILQGPMTRVSDVAAFAEAVAGGGGLPFLALALLREAETERLLRETSALLGDRPWGVGILGFVPPELRAEQLNAVLKVRPRFALLAGGRPDQARALESHGIATYIHTPSVKLLELFLKDGARRFVFEGRECGGHVGPLSSLVLWESMLEVLLDFRGTHDTEEIHVVFAGGIHDGLSAAMASALAAPAVSAGIRFGVLMGTAYLFTRESVGARAIVPAFQEEALRCQTTVLLDMEGGHAIRCAPSAYVGEFMARKRSLLRSGATVEDARQDLEAMNIGRLRVASKGVAHAAAPEGLAGGAGLVEVPVDRQQREGMYMIGQVAALRHDLCSIEELHKDVAHGSAERLRSNAPETRIAGSRAARRSAGHSPEPIAVIGMACLFPGASGLAQFWSNILRRCDAIREVPGDRWRSELFYDTDPKVPDRVVSKWGGFLDPILFDPLTYGIPPTSLRSIEPVQLLMLEVVRRAFADAGYDRRPFPRERTGVIVGTGGQATDLALAYQTRCMVEHYLAEIPGLDPAVPREVVARFRHALPELTEDSFPGILANVTAGRVANRFNLGGPNFVVDAACASSLAALEAAVKELRHGTSDLMVVGASDTQMAPFTFVVFSKTHALSRSGRCRPFDASADGIALGEGVAAVLLKRLDDARRDGDGVYAVIREIAGASDGRDKSLTAPSLNGQQRTLARTYASVDFSPSSVGLVEAHGTGTVVGDRTELETLRAVFETADARPQSCALGSVKSQIGHTKNVAGLAGFIKAAMALRHRVLPPTLVEEPNAAVRDRRIPFYLNTRARPWFRTDGEPRRAAVSAFGFGGTNYHAVLEELEGHAVAPAERPAELFVFRGASRSALANRLEVLGRALAAAGSDVRLIDLAATLDRESANAQGTSRLAIVAADVDDLRRRLAGAAQTLRANAVFPAIGPVAYGEAPFAGDVAFLFPGQGSQYLNMLEEIALHFPIVREIFEQADRALSGVLSTPLSAVIFPPPAYSPAEEAEQRRTLDQTWFAQPALGSAGFALYSLFETLGITPDAVGGHSYGEYVALCAGGSLTCAELIRISELRGRVVQETQGRDVVGMAAVRERAEVVAKLLEGTQGVTIAGRNAPTQTIIGGRRAAIDAVLPRLDAAGISYRVLPMSAGFHIPEARPAAQRFAEVLEGVRFAPPTLRVYSNGTGQVYSADSAAIRKILIEQLTEPLRFQDQIEAMYGAGVRTFVEVGPGQVLSGLVREILGDRTALILASNPQGSTGALADFLNAVGRLFVAGASLRWEGLFAGCQIRLLEVDELLKERKPPSPTAWLVDGARAKPLGDGAHPPSSPPAQAAVGQPKAPAICETPHGGAKAARTDPLSLPAPPAYAPTPGQNGNIVAPQAMHAFQTAMRQFLDYQARAQEQRQQLMQRFLETQRAITAAYFGGAGDGHSSASPHGAAPRVETAFASSPTSAAAQEPPPRPEPSPGAPPQPAGSPPQESEKLSIEQIVLGLVSERTGYPPTMLELDHNMEADLGIDSIKRTEIFGMLRDRLGLSGEQFENEEYFLTIGKLRTLRQVLQWVNEQASAATEVRPALEPAGVTTAPPPSDGRMVQAPARPQQDVPVRRCVVQPMLSPIAEEQWEPREGEIVLVTGDAHGMASEVVSGLRAVGYRVAHVRHAATPRIVGRGVYEVDCLSRDALKQLRDWIGEHFGKIRGICHLLPLEPGPSAGAESLEVRSLLLLASTFGPDLREAEGMLIAVTGMGGTLGIQETSSDFRPGGAAVPGFLKALAHEWPQVRIKSIDVDPREGREYLVSQLFAEIMTRDRTVELGYTRAGRWTLASVEAPLAPAAQPAVELTSESVILVTGGARGIAAAVCAELASRHHPQLILVGRSPLSEAEDPDVSALVAASDLKRVLMERRRNRGELITPRSVEEEYQGILRRREIRAVLEQLASRGARVEYHAVDVRDACAFEALTASVYDRFGRLDGVIHAAGVLKDGLVLDKPMESFDLVFDTKVASALTLARALRPDSLRFLAFFSSVAARFGNAGQTDYAAANEVLNKLARKLDREWPARVVSIGWGPWDEVGMAYRGGPELRSRQASAGLAYLSVAAGCEQFLREITFGRKGDPEVLIFAPHGERPRIAGLDDTLHLPAPA